MANPRFNGTKRVATVRKSLTIFDWFVSRHQHGFDMANRSSRHRALPRVVSASQVLEFRAGP